MPPFSRRPQFRPQGEVFRSFISALSVIFGVLLPCSSLFEASSAMSRAVTILPVMLITYAYATLVMMHSFSFRSMADRLRFIPQHIGFGVVISKVFDSIGICLPDSSVLDGIYLRLWAVILSLFIYNADNILQILLYVEHMMASVADLLLRLLHQDGVFLSFISAFSVIFGVLFSYSSPFEASSAMIWALTILLILIIYANARLVPSFSFWSMADRLRFIAQDVCSGVFISKLFDFIEMRFPDSLIFEGISIRLWAVIICLFVYNVDGILEIMPYVQFTSIADSLRFIPRHAGFGNLIEGLNYIVQWHFPNSSPLVENSTRRWIFCTSRFIYRCTFDVISGSLVCATLISLLISRDEAPIYVFIIWAILVASYLKNNGEATPGN